MDKFLQELSTASANANVAQAASSDFFSLNGGAPGSYKHFRGRANSFRGRARGRHANITGNRTTCQLCNKYGHGIIDWWHMYDEYFEPPLLKQQKHVSSSSGPIHVHDNQRNQAFIFSHASGLLTHQDNLWVPRDLESHAWFANSCAYHHITFFLLNLQNVQSYAYPNEILVGNVHSLVVKSLGLSYFRPKSMSNSMLKFNNRLHVPNITRNLISVSKYAKDKNVFFEFHSNKYYVKSQTSSLVLLEWFLGENGLYFFNIIALEPYHNVTSNKSHNMYCQ